MNIYEDHAAALRSLQTADCPTIWFNGRAVKIFKQSGGDKLNLDVGGLSPEAGISFTALSADFSAVFPASRLGFNFPGETGRAYTIESVTIFGDTESNPRGHQVRITSVADGQKA